MRAPDSSRKDGGLETLLEAQGEADLRLGRDAELRAKRARQPNEFPQRLEARVDRGAPKVGDGAAALGDAAGSGRDSSRAISIGASSPDLCRAASGKSPR